MIINSHYILEGLSVLSVEDNEDDADDEVGRLPPLQLFLLFFWP